MRVLVSAFAIAVVLCATAGAQPFPPPSQVTPQGTLQPIPPNLNGTWDSAAGGIPGRLTLRTREDNVITGNFWPMGLFNDARYPCSGQYSPTQYTFVVLCRSDRLGAMVFAGRGEAIFVDRAGTRVSATRLNARYYKEVGSGPPGYLVGSAFPGTPVQ